MPIAFSSPSASSPVSGQYADSDDLYDRYGNNITQWSNLDNDDSAADNGRIQRALDYADGSIDSYFGSADYTIPFVGFVADDAADVKLTHWASVIASAWLYHKRGQQDNNAIGDKLTDDLDAVYAEMALYRAGVHTLGATRRDTTMPTAPVAV